MTMMFSANIVVKKRDLPIDIGNYLAQLFFGLLRNAAVCFANLGLFLGTRRFCGQNCFMPPRLAFEIPRAVFGQAYFCRSLQALPRFLSKMGWCGSGKLSQVQNGSSPRPCFSHSMARSVVQVALCPATGSDQCMGAPFTRYLIGVDFPSIGRVDFVCDQTARGVCSVTCCKSNDHFYGTFRFPPHFLQHG